MVSAGIGSRLLVAIQLTLLSRQTSGIGSVFNVTMSVLPLSAPTCSVLPPGGTPPPKSVSAVVPSIEPIDGASGYHPKAARLLR